MIEKVKKSSQWQQVIILRILICQARHLTVLKEEAMDNQYEERIGKNEEDRDDGWKFMKTKAFIANPIDNNN